MYSPLITIVIPVYNVEGFLGLCVKSILSQTYRNLEIILVDDGSTDSSGRMCDEFALSDNRIRVIHQANAGLSAARNSGIDISNGKYITFVDSDDEIAPDMIEYLYKLLIENDADMSSCQLQTIDEEDNYLSSQNNVNDIVVGSTTTTCLEFFLRDARLDVVAWSKLYLLSMFDNVRYPVGKYHEDVFTTYKIISKCKRISIGGERKYLYRIRKQSITTSSFSEKHLDMIAGKLECNNFIESNYPHLKKYSHAEIVYACNICLLRMIKSRFYNKKIIQELQKYYRKYEWDYLSNNRAKIKGKLFSVLAFANVNLLVKFSLLMREAK